MPYLHSNIEHHNLDSVFAGVKQFFFFFYLWQRVRSYKNYTILMSLVKIYGYSKQTLSIA